MRENKTPSLPSQMNRSEFTIIFGPVYENSPWVAEATFDFGISRSHDNPESLSNLMSKQVKTASKDTLIKLLKSHPELAGRLAQNGQMTENSINEQSSAGLDNCTSEELQRFTVLNREYKKKFGFPFVLAVRGYNRSEILKLFEQRIRNDYDCEFRNAIEQVNKIAALRVADIMSKLT